MSIASLESLYGRKAFYPFLEAGAVDVAIIDATWNGVWESAKIAALCDMYSGLTFLLACRLSSLICGDRYDVNVAAHNFAGHVGTLMSANFLAAIPNFRVLECDFEDVPWKDALVTHPPEIVDGEMLVPTRPGWGSDVNEEVVRAHPTKNSPTWHALVGTGSIGSADLPPGARL